MIFCLLGGWICGALGMGGGVIYNNLFMAWGVPPAVATSTSMYLITFASLASTVSYWISGELVITYAGWVAVMA